MRTIVKRGWVWIIEGAVRWFKPDHRPDQPRRPQVKFSSQHTTRATTPWTGWAESLRRRPAY